MGLNSSAPPFATRQKDKRKRDWNKAASPAFCGCEASLGKRMTANRVFLSKKGIRVNSVCQSLTRTGMTEDMMVDKDLLGLPSGFRSGASASLGKLQP
jgi:hypothetical protein